MHEKAYKNIGSIAIYYEWYFRNNSSKTLVLLHERLGSVAQWKDFPKSLFEQSGFNVLVYDRSGYGKSARVADDYPQDYLRYEAYRILPQLLDSLKIDNCFLFGHSDGATIALLFAAQFPDRAESLISEAAHVIIEDISIKGITNVRSIYQEKLKKPLQKYHAEKTDWVFYHWTDIWLNPEFKSWNMFKELKQIHCPVFAVQGKNDEYGSPEQLHLIAEHANAETLLIEDCGHIPHFQKRDLVMNKTLLFLNRL